MIIWEVWKQRIEFSLNNRDVSPPLPPSIPTELRKVNFPTSSHALTIIELSLFLRKYCEGCDLFSKEFWRSQSTYFLWCTGNYFLPPWVGLPLSLSGKIWGNPIKSRAPPVSNTGGIKMSRARYRHPHRIMLPHNFNQRIRKSKNGSVIFEFDSANTGEKEKFWD